MFLLTGLGNPGTEYENTRHNAGFMAADEFVRRYNFSGWKKRFNGETAEGTIDGEKIIVLKPLTFMNNSGQAVRAAMDFFKLPVEKVVVMHDDMDLPVGKVKAKTGGGAGGHNGLRSIDAHCSQDYARVRFGVGHPQSREQVVNWVLTGFSKADKDIINETFEDVAEVLPVLFREGTAAFTSGLAVYRSKRKG